MSCYSLDETEVPSPKYYESFSPRHHGHISPKIYTVSCTVGTWSSSVDVRLTKSLAFVVEITNA
jgi:hypothetical protein